MIPREAPLEVAHVLVQHLIIGAARMFLAPGDLALSPLGQGQAQGWLLLHIALHSLGWWWRQRSWSMSGGSCLAGLFGLLGIALGLDIIGCRH